MPVVSRDYNKRMERDTEKKMKKKVTPFHAIRWRMKEKLFSISFLTILKREREKKKRGRLLITTREWRALSDYDSKKEMMTTITRIYRMKMLIYWNAYKSYFYKSYNDMSNMQMAVITHVI